MKRGIWILIAVGIVFVLVGVVVILMMLPLGPGLSLSPTLSPTATASLAAVEVPVATASPVPLEDDVCGSGSMLFLVLGESQPPRGADAIRLVKVDFDNKQVNLLSLPSELWVSTPGLPGIGGTTLNQVYLQGKIQASGDDQARMLAATNLFADTLQVNFGYTAEHYFVIKQAVFSDFVDALNGVDVVLPVAVDGRTEGMGYFPAGSQHLTGALALDLARISVDGELARFARQELIIQAMYKALMKPENWDRLPAMVEAFHENIITDLSVDQMLDISCILKQPGVVVSQEQVDSNLVVMNGATMMPSPELGSYLLQTVGK